MKRAHWLYAAAFSLMTTPVLAEMTGNMQGLLGQKVLDEDDWGILDRQTEVGMLLDVRDTRWPISMAIDVLGSADTVDTPRGEVTGTTVELDLGVRKVFNIPGNALHPYVGGGLALMATDFERDAGFGIASDDDTGTGYWVSGGVFWTFASNLNLGLDVRYSRAEVDLFNNTIEAGGTHAGLLVGYHW